MPAMPAPSTSTDAPGGALPTAGGPVQVDSAATPRLLIAWYIAALPAVMPIIRSHWRRVSAVPPSLFRIRCPAQ